MARSRLKDSEAERPSGGSYFSAPRTVQCFPSGCALLDCVLGGGWAEGRILNVVGDKSTGKTLIAIEACANFALKYPNGSIFYNEVESAFDRGYAAALGMPVDRVDFVENCFTVEDVFKHMEGVVKDRVDSPALYILDSLDAVSDKAELERDFDASNTFGAAKAKKMSELFRRMVQHLERSRVTVMIISQVRDNIGVTFGEKHSRSGGRALDFYSSQVIWLAHMKRIEKTKKGVKRIVGIEVKAQCKKNKVSMPFRDCTFPITFAFGIDDVKAGVDWLVEVGQTKRLFDSEDDAKRFVKTLDKLTDEEYATERAQVSDAVVAAWTAIEEEFLPKRKKYGEEADGS